MSRPLNKGKVLWWRDDKGWGYIRMEDGQDVFAHYSHIDTRGTLAFKTLNVDEEVEFDLYTGPKGLEARDIKRKAH